MDSRPRQSGESGFSLVEVMVTMTVLVVGLLAVASAATSTSLLRKRGMEETAVVSAMVGRLEWVRGELYSDSDLHAAAIESLALGEPYTQLFTIDTDGDGVQDLSAAPDDNETPILRVTVRETDAGLDPSIMVQVDVDATWYGVGGTRTRTVSSLVANRRGYGD